MKTKRILVAQDLSCLGQCSLTVALPIISALGIEVCPVPTTLLSTHTVGFDGYVKADLAEHDNAILQHFKRLDMQFDGLYAGYLGGSEYINVVKEALGVVRGRFILDPAMADETLYPDLDAKYVDDMRALAGRADVLLPNLTEALLLAGCDISAGQDHAPINVVNEADMSCSHSVDGNETDRAGVTKVADISHSIQLDELFSKLYAIGSKFVIITGVADGQDRIGIAVGDGREIRTYMRKRYDRVCHGAGDVFASTFTGLYLDGADLFDSAEAALDFTHKCIQNTLDDKPHWYGLHFERLLPALMSAIKEIV